MKTIKRKKGVQKRASKRNGILIPRMNADRIRAEIKAMFPEGQATYSFNLPAIYTAVSMETHQQPVVLDNWLLNLTANRYVITPEQLWLVKSIVGSESFGEAVSESRILDNSFFEQLFSRVPATFCLSNDEAWLLGYDNELTRADFGPLTKITLLEAIQRYGLAVVEQAKEKTAVRL